MSLSADQLSPKEWNTKPGNKLTIGTSCMCCNPQAHIHRSPFMPIKHFLWQRCTHLQAALGGSTSKTAATQFPLPPCGDDGAGGGGGGLAGRGGGGLGGGGGG